MLHASEKLFILGRHVHWHVKKLVATTLIFLFSLFLNNNVEVHLLFLAYFLTPGVITDKSRRLPLVLCQGVPVNFAEFSDIFQQEQFIH